MMTKKQPKKLDDLDFVFDAPMPKLKQNSFLMPGPQLTERHIYLHDEFEDKADHIENLHAIRTASEFDSIVLWLNNGGGLLDVATEYYDAICSSAAEITANIGSSCASACTMVALACHDWRITPFSSFMIHSVAYGSIGRDHEVKYQSQFQTQQNEKLIRLIYSGFLTENEIVQVQEGRPFYFGSEELVERFKEYSEYRKQLAEQPQSDEDDDSEIDMVTVKLKKQLKLPDGTVFKRGTIGYTENKSVDGLISVIFELPDGEPCDVPLDVPADSVIVVE